MKKFDIDKIIKKIIKQINIKPQIAIVVGSGITVDFLENKTEISYKSLGLPSNKVKGHSGKFVFGKYENKDVVIFSRYHYFEYLDMSIVKLPYEILSRLGIEQVIMQSSCGAVDKTLNIGDIVLIKDHINFSVNPLLGIEPLKFVNMSNAYNKEQREKIIEIAKANNIDIKSGTHAQMSGPSYETVAELNMLRIINVSTVSMSLVNDCIFCNYFNIKVLAFCVVTNKFKEEGDASLNHKEVLEQAKLFSTKLEKLLKLYIKSYR